MNEVCFCLGLKKRLHQEPMPRLPHMNINKLCWFVLLKKKKKAASISELKYILILHALDFMGLSINFSITMSTINTSLKSNPYQHANCFSPAAGCAYIPASFMVTYTQQDIS